MKPSPVDTDIKLEFLDVPRLHCYNDVCCDDFFESLANADDINLFNYRAIQTIINYKWPLVKKFTIYRLFFPFVIFLLTFVIYNNYVFPLKG